LCDTTGGITAKFLHIAAQKDKPWGQARGKRDRPGRSACSRHAERIWN